MIKVSTVWTANRLLFHIAKAALLPPVTRSRGELSTRRRAQGGEKHPRAAAWVTLPHRSDGFAVHGFSLISAGRAPRGVFHGGGRAAPPTHASADAVGNARGFSVRLVLV